MAELRVVFMGTPAYAIPVLQSVLALGWTVAGVYTAPDRHAGRGRRLQAAPVKEYAVAEGLLVCQPNSLRPQEEVQRLQALEPDLLLVAAYGKLLTGEVLAIPTRGRINVHPSLLPKYRGASPVAGAILVGDAITGVTLIEMDEGFDSGPILVQREEPIHRHDTTLSLTERLFKLSAMMVEEILPSYVAGTITPLPQRADEATFTRRLTKEDGRLIWSKPAVELEREVRAYEPWPGSATTWLGKRLVVLAAGVAPYPEGMANVGPGRIVALPEADASIGVVTGDGVLVLHRVKLAGRPEVTAAEFLHGHPEFVGGELPS